MKKRMCSAEQVMREALALRLLNRRITLKGLAWPLECSIATVFNIMEDNPEVRDYIKILNDAMRHRKKKQLPNIRIFSAAAIKQTQARRAERMKLEEAV